MPYVTIRVTGKPVSQAQSEALIERTTQVIQDVLDKDPEITWVVIEEVPAHHWGVGGRTYASRASGAGAREPGK